MLLCEASTGVGKSALNITVATRDSGVVLVPSRILQDQMSHDWPDIPIMKGQRNYTCGEMTTHGVGGVEVSCEHGKARGCNGGGCAYKMAKADFADAEVAITNYAWFFATMMGDDTSALDNKAVIIGDEAHCLPEQLIGAAELTVRKEDLKIAKVDGVSWPSSYDEVCDLTDKLEVSARTTLASMKSAKDKSAQVVIKLERLVSSLSYFNGNRDDEEWVYIPDTFHDESFTMKVLSASGLYGKLIEPLKKRVLLTSATMPDTKLWSRWTGIPRDRIKRLIIPSPFHLDNREVFFWPAADMSYKSLQTGKPMRQMAEKLSKLLDHHHDQKGIVHCLDEKTRVLTKNGFKGVYELSVDDEVATLNPNTKELEYQKPSTITKRYHCGDMIHVDKRGLDMLVTDEHRVYTMVGKNSDTPEIIEAKQLITGIRRFKTGNRAQIFRIPVTAEKWAGEPVDHDYARFLGWFCAEGNISYVKPIKGVRGPMHRINISQQNILDTEIPYLLLSLGLPLMVGKMKTCERVTVTRKELYHRLKDQCYEEGSSRGCFRKKVPEIIKNADKETIKQFLSALIEGDGTTRKDSKLIRSEHPGVQYYTSSDRLCEDVVELCLKVGWRANFAKMKFYKGRTLNGHVLNQTKVMNVVYIGSGIRAERCLPGDAKVVQYDGMVYCPTVPNGIIFVERNGKTYWTGNCNSFKISEQLMAEMDRKYLKRLLIQERGMDRDALMLQHQLSKEPTVLVSPSMTEGLDLKDDLSRFCAFVKAPYPAMQDPWIKRKMVTDDDWYGWQTARAIVQGAGRSVRHRNDYAVTYLLDQAFSGVWDRCRYYMPKWFRDSVSGF